MGTLRQRAFKGGAPGHTAAKWWGRVTHRAERALQVSAPGLPRVKPQSAWPGLLRIWAVGQGVFL